MALPADSAHGCHPDNSVRTARMSRTWQTESSMSQIITVFGATGAQGGGLAKAILADPSGASRCGPSPADRMAQRRGHGPRPARKS